jgi:hypothetical protein
MAERRSVNRLADSELDVSVLPNDAGGVIVRVLHRPSKRYASAGGRNREEAERQAKRHLARMLARLRWRKAKGLSDR